VPIGRRHLLRRPGLRPVLLAVGLAALLLSIGDRAVVATSAGTAVHPALARVAHQPAATGTPQAPPIVIYPPPLNLPVGVSICGPLFNMTQRPTCKASGTIISGERGELALYAIVIKAAPIRGFPNITRDLSESQQVVGSLYTVLGHAKFSGLLSAIQVIPLSDIQARLGLQLLADNIYRIEVDQKTGNPDLRYYLVGAASFNYIR
jgi:hypothetical protein